ncbi:MAG: hypothetical protein ACFCU6_08860, partial [Balneolaceae bacterium]
MIQFLQQPKLPESPALQEKVSGELKNVLHPDPDNNDFGRLLSEIIHNFMNFSKNKGKELIKDTGNSVISDSGIEIQYRLETLPAEFTEFRLQPLTDESNFGKVLNQNPVANINLLHDSHIELTSVPQMDVNVENIPNDNNSVSIQSGNDSANEIQSNFQFQNSDEIKKGTDIADEISETRDSKMARSDFSKKSVESGIKSDRNVKGLQNEKRNELNGLKQNISSKVEPFQMEVKESTIKSLSDNQHIKSTENQVSVKNTDVNKQAAFSVNTENLEIPEKKPKESSGKITVKNSERISNGSTFRNDTDSWVHKTRDFQSNIKVQTEDKSEPGLSQIKVDSLNSNIKKSQEFDQTGIRETKADQPREMAAVKMDQLPLFQQAERRVFPGKIAQVIRQELSSGKAKAQGWQKHQFTLDDGSKIQIS